MMPRLLIIAACLVPFTLAQNTTLTVDLGYATYQSNVSLASGVTSFLGIRYASPPVGELRWQPPQRPANESDIQQATVLPHECIQGSNGLSATNPFERRSLVKRSTDSEDCLFLNVHIPSNFSSNSRLPVIFWIHGGGYVSGNGTEPAQDFVKESGYQVISVNAQYRLGLFGFLPGQEVKDNGVLNAGLLDQQFALQWVQDHIASFGGDPAKVTIWGESAGAGSVLQHVVANGGNTQPPLFRAAMMSSSFLPFQYDYNDTIPEKLYSEVVIRSNCTNSSESLSCLRSADVSILTEANNEIGAANFYGTYAWVPVVDGTFSVDRPSVLLNRSQLNGEALLAVTNSYEGNIFVNASAFDNTSYTLTDYVSSFFSLMNEAQIRQTVEIYSNVSDLPDVLSQAEAVMGENIFICPTYYALQAFGLEAWKGEFAVPPATHGLDLVYYFQSASDEQPQSNTDFSNAFSGAFLDFAASLNESQKLNSSTITPPWSQWSNGHTEMLFNLTASSEPVIQTITTDDALLERCEWWRSLSEVNRQ
ncbi:alpha/beta-hydrolase [Stereum hirsutum FP-91666 SS1]|uniref:alpha/beta-hydrolase n=1 Tax=Stereum hirsutum (strain FP-91666) TaxID=721885 RepID=UPI000440D2FE|nr:alpha/beta-hydrolase [Stereum hirsutum FP-91666 SS1]EIM89556.1 alpha/beta-hydrolase [Stereum hirsutum FP-91666 SS1]